MGRPRTWTDDDLRSAVAAAVNLSGVFRNLSLAVGGASWVAIQEHILRLELDTSHWTSGRRPGAVASREALPSWTENELREAYEGARSLAEVMRRLGMDSTSKRGRAQLERDLRRTALDPGRLLGQRWAKGHTVRAESRGGRSLEEILVRNSPYTSSHHLKLRLIAAGVKQRRCEICGLTTWRDQPVPLHLDHIDGDRRNNVLSNLRLLCPNCHALTDTYCGRNIGAGYSR